MFFRLIKYDISNNIEIENNIIINLNHSGILPLNSIKNEKYDNILNLYSYEAITISK